jgi:hypothetical protein
MIHVESGNAKSGHANGRKMPRGSVSGSSLARLQYALAQTVHWTLPTAKASAIPVSPLRLPVEL